MKTKQKIKKPELILKRLLTKNILYLTVMFLLAFVIRVWNLSSNLFFGPEQGTDFLVIRDLIEKHKFTLIGAKTDLSGIYHGPIYYYIAAIPFLVSHGNPLFVAYFLIALNCLSVYILYLLGKKLFNSRVGLISASLFTVSFLTVIYPRWLSTHPLAIPFSIAYFLCLTYFLQNRKWALMPAAVMFGLLAQSEFLNLLFYAFSTIILFIIFFQRFKKENVVYLFACVLITVIVAIGPFILFDLRHKFLITNNILQLLKGGSGYRISLALTFSLCMTSMYNFLGDVIFPLTPAVGVIVFLISLIVLILKFLRSNRMGWILVLWFFVPPILLLILRQIILDQYFVSMIPAAILIVAYLIDSLWQKNIYLGSIALIILLCVNVYSLNTDISHNNNIFFQSTQPNLKYSDELAVIKEIYIQANHQPFAIQSYTIPYWSQQGWEYLFWYYGLSHYGYLPIPQKEKTLFVIIQADPSDAVFQNNWLHNTVSSWGKVKSSFTYGDLQVLRLSVPNGLY